MATQQAPRVTLTAPIRRIRFVNVALFFVVWSVLIGGRLVWLQVDPAWALCVDRRGATAAGTFEVAPRRGVLYDRNLRELAMTVLVDSVYAVPSEMADNRAQDAAMLARHRAHACRRMTTSRAQEPQITGAVQRVEELCVGGAACGSGDGDSGSAS